MKLFFYVSSKKILVLFLLFSLCTQTYSQTSVRPRFGPRSERNKTDDQNRKQGTWKYYYPNGELRSELNYLNNLLEGPCKTYFPGEKIMEESNFFSGKRDGDYKKYFIAGQPSIEGKYYMGKKDGHWIIYFETGQIKQEGDFIKGLKDGQWKLYDKKGNVVSDITYKNGVDVNAKPATPTNQKTKQNPSKKTPAKTKTPKAN